MIGSTTAIIDTQAIQHNLQVLRERVPTSKIAAVVKADGYGHGLLTVANALTTASQPADMLAVSTVEEALRLRNNGVVGPVLVLEGFHSNDELVAIQKQHLTPVVYAGHQMDLLNSKTSSLLQHAWLKIDTGMHRLGFAPQDAQGLYHRLQQRVQQPVVLMTHLANAESPRIDNEIQIQAFDQIASSLQAPHSIANSAATWCLPQARRDWVRPGIMLYGVSPFSGSIGSDHQLKPAMYLRSKLIALRDCKPGDLIGYGSRYRCQKNTRIGVVAIGYGDGYPRHVPDGTPVWVAGQQCGIAGMPSMDMLTIALPEDSNANIGDEVELWGRHIAVETIAAAAGTIAYELVCQVQARVHFEAI